MALVERGVEGRRRYIRQQDVEDRPYTNCRVVVAACQLSFAGLRIPNVRAFVKAVRKATNVPEIGQDGESQGTSAADLIYGLGKVVPWVEPQFAKVPWNDIWTGIKRGEFTVSFSITYQAKGKWVLPPALRKSSPTFTGKHQIWLPGAREKDGNREILWVNVLDRVSEQGQWLDWGTVQEYIVKSGAGDARGGYCTLIERTAGMRDAIITDRVFPVPATVAIPKGADVFEFDETRNDLKRVKVTTKASTAKADCTERVRKIPAGAPSGPMVRLISPESMAGKRVRATQVTVTEAPGGDCAAQVAAATAPLKADLAERDAYIAAVRAIPVPDATK